MHSSSTLRRKAPHLPWLAAMILGATAHTTWLIHDLRDHQIDAHVQISAEPSWTSTVRCRHADADVTLDEPWDLDLLIHRTGRQRYAIDRKAVEQLSLASSLPEALVERGAVELRNIQRGSPLYLLGLRTGDRVLAIAHRRERVGTRVAVTIERRGRRLALTYDIG